MALINQKAATRGMQRPSKKKKKKKSGFSIASQKFILKSVRICRGGRSRSRIFFGFGWSSFPCSCRSRSTCEEAGFLSTRRQQRRTRRRWKFQWTGLSAKSPRLEREPARRLHRSGRQSACCGTISAKWNINKKFHLFSPSTSASDCSMLPQSTVTERRLLPQM